ncbi:MAG: UDP-4-amino-4,6-dideoxy-N-acetyl-beta-L-altrosamine N-acetyltransferase [Saprospiraceae bacterium]
MENDILLTDLIEDDIELVRSWRNSQEVSQFMYTDQEISPEDQLRWFEKGKDNPSRRELMISYNGGKIGLATLYNINYRFNSSYWAFYLGDLSFRGAGIGSKVEYNILALVFDSMNFNKLLCEVFISNDPVINMHEKFGFRREGYFRQHIYKNNQYHDIVSMAMLNSEWQILKDYHKKRIYERTSSER